MSLPESPRAVVTGAGSGLGRALSLALARRGGKIVLADIDLPGAEETAEAVLKAGGQAVVQRADVAQLAEVEALAELADRQFGGTDLVANNAGVGVAGPIGEIALRDWEWIVGINLWGVIYGCHVFAPRFKQQKSGHILNVASIAGLVSTPEMSPYNVTKAGVVALSETLCSELMPFGVGVTVVCPTFFKTKIVDQSRFIDMADKLSGLARAEMERSKVQADDVAEAALKCCQRGKLYCLPMADGRWAWRIMRLLPNTFYRRLVPGAARDALRSSG